MKKQSRYIPTESEEQQVLFAWVELTKSKFPDLSLMYHIPNEGKRSNYTGNKLKSEGLKKGVPDICLPVSNEKYHALYIELKRNDNKAKASTDQKEWIEKLNESGNLAVVCHGWESAKDVIIKYLSGK